MISEIEPLAISVPEMASRLGIGLSLAWRLVHEGEIRTVRVGRRVVVPTIAIEEFMRNIPGSFLRGLHRDARTNAIINEALK